jgi:protein gp37
MSAIEWTDATWNPVTGCDRVSPGCAHCYALTLAKRLKGMGQPKYQRDGDPKTSGPGFGVTLHPDTIDEPLRWRRPRMVFVNSMSDLFHEEIPDEFIYSVLDVMSACSQHTFQVLTKRPERARDLLTRVDDLGPDWGVWRLEGHDRMLVLDRDLWPRGRGLRNVWIGVSIENSRYTWRADVLREIPAAVRFISAEPLLGSLFIDHREARVGNAVRKPLDLTGIDWLIVGGESGGRFARPMHPDWARELRDAALATQYPPICCGNPDYGMECCGQYLPTGECCSNPRPGDPECCMRPEPSPDPGTAFFFKQWGSWGPGYEDDRATRPVKFEGHRDAYMVYGGAAPKSGGRLLDGREWNEMPTREAVPV